MDAKYGPSISTARLGNEIVIRVKGDLDFSATPEFVKAVESAMDDTTPEYFIDCKEVTFIDSESLKAILAVREKLRQTSRFLGLRNCSKPVARVVKLLGLEEVLCRR